MKAGRIFFILIIIILGIIIYINKCKDEKGKPGPAGSKGPQVLSVRGIIVSALDIEDKIKASGSILSSEEVHIKNEVPGKVTGIFFKEGSRVKKGELLLTLFDDDLQAQLRKLHLQKEIAQKTEERQKDLLSVNGISQQEYEASLNQLNTVIADIDLILSELSRTKITAPFDGYVGLKNVSPGAVLPANTHIASIQILDPVKLEFFIPERYRSFISTETKVNFTTKSAEGNFTGEIYAIEPKIDPVTRSVMVRALCENRNLNLVPGSFAAVEIPLKKIQNAMMIPTQAVIPEMKGKRVYIAKNGIAEKIAIETGIRNDSSIQILSGLQSGDTVLVTGLLQLKPGIPLKINLK
jgi:membrane fusion protein (multidrug efflux system)